MMRMKRKVHLKQAVNKGELSKPSAVLFRFFEKKKNERVSWQTFQVTDVNSIQTVFKKKKV